MFWKRFAGSTSVLGAPMSGFLRDPNRRVLTLPQGLGRIPLPNLLISNCSTSTGPPETYLALDTLSQVYIHCASHHPLEENATSCLQVLYVACPILRKLHISWRGSFTDRPPESWMGPVDFRILSNLTRLRNLEEFRLLDNYPVMINDEELIQLVSGCPRLRTLHLNPDPFNPSATTVTLRVIGLLSVHCPWLEDLALYLDSENSTVDEILDVTTGTSFKHLVKLSFGASPTSALRANNILSYLGHLLSPQCKIVPSAFISPSQVSPNPTSVEYRQMWEYIASLRRNRYKSITEGR